MHLEGRLIVQCNNCSRRHRVNIDDLEDNAFCIGEGNMGAQIEHDFESTIDCDCGSELQVIIQGFEYPPGAFNYQSHEIEECRLIEEPDVVMDYDYDLPEPILSIYEQVLVNPRAMYDLEPWQFENFVSDVFSRNGFKVRVTQKTRDGGKDIVATFEMGGILYNTYFECKKYAPNRPVDVAIVREEYAVMQRDHIDKAIIVTTSRFTRDAKREADKFGIGLVDYDKLLELMQKARREPHY